MHGFGDDQASCRFLQDMLDSKDQELKTMIKERVRTSLTLLDYLELLQANGRKVRELPLLENSGLR